MSVTPQSSIPLETLFEELCEEACLHLPCIDHPAEVLARQVLESANFDFSCIKELVSLLPSEGPARSEDVFAGAHSWT